MMKVVGILGLVAVLAFAIGFVRASSELPEPSVVCFYWCDCGNYVNCCCIIDGHRYCQRLDALCIHFGTPESAHPCPDCGQME